MFESDNDKWRALEIRDVRAEGVFFYVVKTTHVVCRPTCSSRLAHRKNIEFVKTYEEARQRGFRPCKRCKPDDESWNQQRAKIQESCAVLQWAANAGADPPALGALSAKVGFTKWHFARVFKNYTGLAPIEYFRACREGRLDATQELPKAVTKKFLSRMKQIRAARQLSAEGVTPPRATKRVLQAEPVKPETSPEVAIPEPVVPEFTQPEYAQSPDLIIKDQSPDPVLVATPPNSTPLTLKRLSTRRSFRTDAPVPLDVQPPQPDIQLDTQRDTQPDTQPAQDYGDTDGDTDNDDDDNDAASVVSTATEPDADPPTSKPDGAFDVTASVLDLFPDLLEDRAKFNAASVVSMMRTSFSRSERTQKHYD